MSTISVPSNNRLSRLRICSSGGQRRDQIVTECDAADTTDDNDDSGNDLFLLPRETEKSSLSLCCCRSAKKSAKFPARGGNEAILSREASVRSQHLIGRRAKHSRAAALDASIMIEASERTLAIDHLGPA